MSETLKAWATNASRNPYNEDQKQHADDTLKLFVEIDTLRVELNEQCRLNGMGAQRELKLITERNNLRAALEKIANDFMPENVGEMAMALSEARDCAREALNVKALA